jgi:hypothetical protein
MKYISTTLISFLFLLNSNLFSQAPIADFSFSPNGCVGLGHNFTDISANAPNSFYWTFGDGGSSTNQNPSYVYLNAGTYLVTFVAMNANGSDTIAYNVTIFSNPIINAGTDETICYGASTGLSASGGISYIWTPSSGLSNSTIANPVASPTSTTNYTVTGTDANGCANTDDITITVSSIIVLNSNVNNVSCYGGSNGDILITPFGGQAPYVYYWTPTGATTSGVYNLTAGNYTVTVTDANGCTQVLNSSVTEPTPIFINFTSVIDVSCFGANDGAININVNGGTVGYSYLWSNASTNFNLTGISAGTYSVTVTDANGCTAIDSVNLTQPSPAGVIRGIVNFQSAHVTAGNVELIKKNGNTPADIIPLSMLFMDTSGTFIFSNLYPGNYILKGLGDTSIYNNFATYATNTNQWLLATEYYTSGCSGDTVNGVTIDLIELPSNSGTGTINGRLVEGSGLFNKAPGEPLGDIDITLNQSPGGTIMAATTTDSLGYFTFINLPMGTYTVYADMHGYDVTLQTIDINATTPSYDVVLCSDTAIDMIEMCEMTVTSVNKVVTTNKLKIYPNPAKDVVNIVYNGNEPLNLEVTDITGKKVMSQTLKTKTIDVSTLNQGLYFVRLYNQSNDFVQKLVVE